MGTRIPRVIFQDKGTSWRAGTPIQALENLRCRVGSRKQLGATWSSRKGRRGGASGLSCVLVSLAFTFIPQVRISDLSNFQSPSFQVNYGRNSLFESKTKIQPGLFLCDAQQRKPPKSESKTKTPKRVRGRYCASILNPSTGVLRQAALRLEGSQPGSYSKFQVSLNYRTRPCSKINKQI